MREVRQLWIDALLSGEYQQGKGRLRLGGIDSKCFCAAGLLANILDPNGWVYHESLGWYWHGNHFNLYIDNTGPLSVATDISPSVVKAVTVKNDDEGSTFQEIAEFLKLESLPGIER
jgi:hypothetical protein